MHGHVQGYTVTPEVERGLTSESLREELAGILEAVARDGLPGSRDLDVALEAILSNVASALSLD